MKNAKKLILATFVVSSLFAASSAFAGSCTVSLKFPDGSTLKGIRVGAPGAQDVYTDNNGIAVLTWGGNSKLETIFVRGADQHISCANGSSVSIEIKP